MFVGTHANRIDRKGRVSVPASFRGVLGDAGRFYAFPSFVHKGIECRTDSFMQALADQLHKLDPFSDEQDAFSHSIFAASHTLVFDGEGRIVLPETLRAHAGIDEVAAFVGNGWTFQIWKPATHQAFLKQAQERALAGRLALRQRPQAEPHASRPVESGT